MFNGWGKLLVAGDHVQINEVGKNGRDFVAVCTIVNFIVAVCGFYCLRMQCILFGLFYVILYYTDLIML